MGDSERLSKLKNLCDEYFSTWNTKDQYQIGFIFMQDAEWLIRQAEKAQELQKIRKIVAEAHQCDLEKVTEENTRLRRALKEITYEGHSCRDGSRAVVYQHSLSQAVQIAFNALEENQK